MSAGSLVSTGVFGTNVDDEVSQIWKQVEIRVVQMAGGDSSKIKSNLDINSVLQHLEQSQSKDKKASEKYGTVENIFNRTLQCIQTVGGIVADGASYVFAPASTCYSALTFVIQAWQGYEGIFESLAGLLEKCIEFLERLTYYTDYGMDSKLTKIACQHLQIFVDICDHTLKLRSKRSKFATFMKQMFLNDDGVQELLGAMKNLVEKEHGLVSAQTWKSSNEAAANSKDGLNLTRNMHTSLVDDRRQKQHERDMNS
ncbi:Fungal STAND N-terminal Goodbye domain [Fusarium oxysporum f. sp. vasinfectum]|nr:Fungal STAND N-terminal Goodbye domain [Fusarium oxysporum f. sp. vasinfectum]KAK2930389.1 Fungal STAND N-terminal Goodbye domain [Fusarium oxysporum f. sp. vasinfectum]